MGKDERLMRLVRQGRTEYLEEIVSRHYDDVYRFCRFQTGDPQAAYDLAQETFLRFIQYAEHCKDSPRAYLLTVARNVCRDHWRERKRRNETALPDPEAGEPFGEDGRLSAPGERRDTAYTGAADAFSGRTETRLLLENALLLLPDFQREALVLHYYYGCKYREIGKMTGVPAATVKSRVRQGCRKLRELLGEDVL